jgi:hypothetical protein
MVRDYPGWGTQAGPAPEVTFCAAGRLPPGISKIAPQALIFSETKIPTITTSTRGVETTDASPSGWHRNQMSPLQASQRKCSHSAPSRCAQCGQERVHNLSIRCLLDGLVAMFNPCPEELRLPMQVNDTRHCIALGLRGSNDGCGHCDGRCFRRHPSSDAPCPGQDGIRPWLRRTSPGPARVPSAASRASLLQTLQAPWTAPTAHSPCPHLPAGAACRPAKRSAPADRRWPRPGPDGASPGG